MYLKGISRINQIDLNTNKEDRMLQFRFCSGYSVIAFLEIEILYIFLSGLSVLSLFHEKCIHLEI